MKIETQNQIEEYLSESKVVIFGKGNKGEPMCGFTARVQTVFEDLESDYEMVNILMDSGLRADLKIFSDWPTFPQVYVNKEFIGGCDIVEAMATDGSLKELLSQ